MAAEPRTAYTLLTDDDVQELTGLQRPADQVRALMRMGIPHRVRNNGTAATTWGAVNAGIIGVQPDGRPMPKPGNGPRLDLAGSCSRA